LATKTLATKPLATKKPTTKKLSKPLTAATEKKTTKKKTAEKKSEEKSLVKKATAKVSAAKKKPAAKPDWYDYPQYFDLGFQDETEKEVAFLPLAFERFGTGEMKRILEPGCGSGRLIVSLAEQGYDVTGFDLSDSMLNFLNKQLTKKKLTATTYKQDMTDFEVDKPYDVVLNTFNTFRHLLTEEAAESHFHAVAKALRPGGLFFFGLHLLPHYADERCIERWTSKTGGTSVTFTLKVTEWDRRKRVETLRISMLIRKPKQEPTRVRSEIYLRTYRLKQLQSLLAKIPELELVETYDFWYEIDEPIELTRDSSDSLLVFRKR
jgi:cyclopropane fatty-acyl-phospholipid synthase-like methyltransferase